MSGVTDAQFDQLISRAMDELPQEYITNLNNVAITYADNPTPMQLEQQGVREQGLLLGLYEGVPQTQRGAYYQFVLPDKITLFKHPLIAISEDDEALFQQVKRTLWHEIAHHYGLEHHDIDERETRQ